MSRSVEIEPPQEAGSTAFRSRGTPDISLEHVQNLQLHRLGSFEDFRLNLEEFPRLQTLVVHIMPDKKVRNANSGAMNDDEVSRSVHKYIWHAQRHRHFRDNLNRLYHMEMKSRNFSLKVRMGHGEGLDYVLVDLDTGEVERGPQTGPLTFLQPEGTRVSKRPGSPMLPLGESSSKIQAYVQRVAADIARRTPQTALGLQCHTIEHTQRCSLRRASAQILLETC